MIVEGKDVEVGWEVRKSLMQCAARLRYFVPGNIFYWVWIYGLRKGWSVRHPLIKFKRLNLRASQTLVNIHKMMKSTD